MNQLNNPPHPFEPTAQELPPEPSFKFKVDRRKFFKMTGGGLAVAFVLHDLLSYAGDEVPPETSKLSTNQVGAWLHIGDDGTISVYTGKVEVGQNIRTSLSQVVAEELQVPLSSITMVMGDTDRVPYDAGTFGSRTTPQMGAQLRKAAATARQSLLEMASAMLNTPVNNLAANNGMIVQKNGSKKILYGALTKGKQLLLPVADNVEVIGPANWHITGTAVPKVNGRSFLNGKHTYVSDMELPGMLYGKMLRAPSYNAKLTSSDVSKAALMPGVTVVRDGDFIGVAAPDARTATIALHAIKATWTENTDQPSAANIFNYLKQNTGSGDGNRNSATSRGNLEVGLAEADIRLSETFTVQYIAHVPLEPRAALAQWENGKLTVWTGTQRPFGVQETLADVFKLTKDKVRVIMPDTGSGYGGKHSSEAAVEAARLAQQTKKPVKVVWTREEEFTWAYFRPGGVIEVNSGVTKNGRITAWGFVNYNSGGSGLSSQYTSNNQLQAYVPAETPLKQGSYRGLASTANVFARESHITDLARSIKMDQLAFRMKNLTDERLKAVLMAAADSFGWQNGKNKGSGYGIACGFEKGGYVATCAEVSVNQDKEVKVVRVTQAFECGAIIHPWHLEQQVLGSIVQGLGGALFEAVDFANGKILNASLSAYRVPRFSDMPEISIVLLDRKDLPSAGAGEAAIIGIAPAIRNAVVDATGIALNTLPLLPNGVLA